MATPRHPKKEIAAAVKYAIDRGWTLELSGGHAWGILWCPFEDRSGCRISVWSTPKNPQNHARKIRRDVDSCPHQGEGPE
jgi:hypothetical protein